MPEPVPSYVFKGTFVAAHDGDTVTIALDHGRYPASKTITEADLRVRGLYCPELRDDGGPEAAEFTRQTLMAAQRIVVQTYRGSFERTVADIWVDGQSFADVVINAGHGTSEDGSVQPGTTMPGAQKGAKHAQSQDPTSIRPDTP